jgi:hypothetical protein
MLKRTAPHAVPNVRRVKPPVKCNYLPVIASFNSRYIIHPTRCTLALQHNLQSECIPSCLVHSLTDRDVFNIESLRSDSNLVSLRFKCTIIKISGARFIDRNWHEFGFCVYMLYAGCLIRPGRCKCGRNIATTDIQTKRR